MKNSINKRSVMLAVAATLGLSACPGKKKANEGGGESGPQLTLPEFDSLKLITPEFSVDTPPLSPPSPVDPMQSRGLRSAGAQAEDSVLKIEQELRRLDVNIARLIKRNDEARSNLTDLEKKILIAKDRLDQLQKRTNATLNFSDEILQEMKQNPDDRLIVEQWERSKQEWEKRRKINLRLHQELSSQGTFAGFYEWLTSTGTSLEDQTLSARAARANKDEQQAIDQEHEALIAVFHGPWMKLEQARSAELARLSRLRQLSYEDSKKVLKDLADLVQQKKALLNEYQAAKVTSAKRNSEIKRLEQLNENAADVQPTNREEELPEVVTLRQLFVDQKQSSETSIDRKELINALLAVHLKTRLQSNPNPALSVDDLKAKLNELARPSDGLEIDRVKPTYEKELAERHHGGKALVYNLKNFRLPDPILENRMQCYSGTMLFLTLNQLLKAPHKNLVVIFKSGHILPGYINVENDKFVLFGIETTASGRALIRFGETANVKGDIRVFDADQFLFMELMQNRIQNFETVYQQMLETMKLYGFNIDQFKPMDQASVQSTDPQALNQSKLGFGRAITPSGDLTREEFDVREEQSGEGGGDVEFQPLLSDRPEESREKNEKEQSGELSANPVIKLGSGEEQRPEVEIERLENKKLGKDDLKSIEISFFAPKVGADSINKKDGLAYNLKMNAEVTCRRVNLDDGVNGVKVQLISSALSEHKLMYFQDEAINSIAFAAYLIPDSAAGGKSLSKNVGEFVGTNAEVHSASLYFSSRKTWLSYAWWRGARPEGCSAIVKEPKGSSKESSLTRIQLKCPGLSTKDTRQLRDVIVKMQCKLQPAP